MSFSSAGYQLQPVLPELVLAFGAMVLLMVGAYRGQGTTRLVPALADTGYDVAYREFDGGHVVPPELAAAAVAWLG